MSDSNLFVEQGVRVAIEGCGHGTLNAIYAAVERSCKERQWDGVDILIIGGDFQAVRNAADLTVMSVPAKYRELGDFHEYYSGARTAPYLTIFVAGNHEASSHLWELYYGGWVAPNIYYMGAANVLRLGPLRIAGMSGIWKGFDYRKPHHERLPFNQDEIKSFYHIREFDVRKLLQLRTQVDVGISHDWPRAIERHGDERRLFKMKPDFERESYDGSLGNPAAEYVLNRLRPQYWFSAHLHCKFSAIKTFEPPTKKEEAKEEAKEEEVKEETDQTVPAPTNRPAEPETATANPDEIDLDMEDDDGDEPTAAAPTTAVVTKETNADKPTSTETKETEDATEQLRAQLPAAFAKPAHQQQPQQHSNQPKTIPGQPVPEGITNTTVRFLALDKCLPGRKFLQLCEISPISTPPPTTATASAPSTTDQQQQQQQQQQQPRSRYTLQYDPEWLAITRAFHPLLTIGTNTPPPPDQGEAHYLSLIQAEEAWVDEHIVKKNKLDVPLNFVHTAPPILPDGAEELSDISTNQQPDEYTNPQTVTFCELVGLTPNYWEASEEERAERKARGPAPSAGGGFGGHGGGRGGGGHRGGGRGGYGGRGGGGYGGRGGGGRGGRGGRGGGGRGGGGGWGRGRGRGA